MSALGVLARYIAARLLLTIGAVFALCLVLIFMIDLIELLRIAGKTGDVPITSILWIVLLRLPSFAELTLPFALLSGTIGAFMLLSRSSELVVTRAAGMSVWQLVLPGITVAVLIGLATNMVYNPLAAGARAMSEGAYGTAFGEQSSLLERDAGQWLRQDGVDGSSVVNATSSADQGMSLSGVQILQFDRKGSFVESIDAKHASLKEGYWALTGVVVTRPRMRPEHYDDYQVSTYLTATEVREALGSEFSVSFWQLPTMIELAEKAGLPAKSFRVQYAMLLSRPLLFAVMVLLAATVSLRTFRFGKIQTKVVVGLLCGFAFFILAEVSRQLGVAGACSTTAAVGAPIAIAGFLSLAVLMHQEDG